MITLRILFAQRGPKLHLFRGRHLTAQQIADITGVKLRTVNRRLQHGLPIDEPARYGPEPKRYEFRGQLLTVPEIATLAGCHVSTVRRRISGDRVLEVGEAPSIDDHHPIERRIRFRGITHTAVEWGRITGIPSHTIRSRLDMGWGIERTLTTPVAFKRPTIIARMVTGFRRTRNAHVIARMAQAFRAARASSTTGGQSKTFPNASGTGGGSLLRDLH